MMQSSGTAQQPIHTDLVLVGGGHSHVIALQMLAPDLPPGVRLSLISEDYCSPYSGMLPGLLAGHYRPEEIDIELLPLCRALGVRFIRARVSGIDPQTQRIVCSNRSEIRYDLLSINIGCRPALNLDVSTDMQTRLIAVKPIHDFYQRWLALLRDVSAGAVNSVAVVGGGAAGVELSLALQHRLGEARGTQTVPELSLLSATDKVLQGSASARAQRMLQARGIKLLTNFRARRYAQACLSDTEGRQVAADRVIWATHASAADWPQAAGLRCDGEGFILVNDSLQSCSHTNIFAAGDCASILDHPRPKAGVYAVRQGKALARSLMARLRATALPRYHPQRQALGLLFVPPDSAIASRGRWSAEGPWLWRWKQHIDQRFMQRFRLPDAPASAPLADSGAGGAHTSEPDSLRCGGCGCKIAAPLLRRVLARLQSTTDDSISIGLAQGDDAAVLQVPDGQQLVQSIDAFRSFIDDPYVFAQVAVEHALSDLYAMGATPHSVQALVTLPLDAEVQQEELLYQLLSGAVSVLNPRGIALLGGHTNEGPELSLGFAVNGFAAPEQLLNKTGVQAGQHIVLSQALGTGTLFAADMRQRARGSWIEAALRAMLQSNRAAARLAQHYAASACTDLTGFGLAGHLREMLGQQPLAACIYPDRLPVLPGALETLKMGIFSSLHAANREPHQPVNVADWKAHPALPLLFDPQTSGGLLIAVDATQSAALVADLHAAGYQDAAHIASIEVSDTGTALRLARPPGGPD